MPTLSTVQSQLSQVGSNDTSAITKLLKSLKVTECHIVVWGENKKIKIPRKATLAKQWQILQGLTVPGQRKFPPKHRPPVLTQVEGTLAGIEGAAAVSKALRDQGVTDCHIVLWGENKKIKIKRGQSIDKQWAQLRGRQAVTDDKGKRLPRTRPTGKKRPERPEAAVTVGPGRAAGGRAKSAGSRTVFEGATGVVLKPSTTQALKDKAEKEKQARIKAKLTQLSKTRRALRIQETKTAQSIRKAGETLRIRQRKETETLRQKRLKASQEKIARQDKKQAAAKKIRSKIAGETIVRKLKGSKILVEGIEQAQRQLRGKNLTKRQRKKGLAILKALKAKETDVEITDAPQVISDIKAREKAAKKKEKKAKKATTKRVKTARELQEAEIKKNKEAAKEAEKKAKKAKKPTPLKDIPQTEEEKKKAFEARKEAAFKAKAAELLKQATKKKPKGLDILSRPSLLGKIDKPDKPKTPPSKPQKLRPASPLRTRPPTPKVTPAATRFLKLRLALKREEDKKAAEVKKLQAKATKLVTRAKPLKIKRTFAEGREEKKASAKRALKFAEDLSQKLLKLQEGQVTKDQAAQIKKLQARAQKFIDPTKKLKIKRTFGDKKKPAVSKLEKRLKTPAQKKREEAVVPKRTKRTFAQKSTTQIIAEETARLKLEETEQARKKAKKFVLPPPRLTEAQIKAREEKEEAAIKRGRKPATIQELQQIARVAKRTKRTFAPRPFGEPKETKASRLAQKKKKEKEKLIVPPPPAFPSAAVLRQSEKRQQQLREKVARKKEEAKVKKALAPSFAAVREAREKEAKKKEKIIVPPPPAFPSAAVLRQSKKRQQQLREKVALKKALAPSFAAVREAKKQTAEEKREREEKEEQDPGFPKARQLKRTREAQKIVAKRIKATKGITPTITPAELARNRRFAALQKGKSAAIKKRKVKFVDVIARGKLLQKGEKVRRRSRAELKADFKALLKGKPSPKVLPIRPPKERKTTKAQKKLKEQRQKLTVEQKKKEDISDTKFIEEMADEKLSQAELTKRVKARAKADLPDNPELRPGVEQDIFSAIAGEVARNLGKTTDAPKRPRPSEEEEFATPTQKRPKKKAPDAPRKGPGPKEIRQLLFPDPSEPEEVFAEPAQKRPKKRKGAPISREQIAEEEEPPKKRVKVQTVQIEARPPQATAEQLRRAEARIGTTGKQEINEEVELLELQIEDLEDQLEETDITDAKFASLKARIRELEAEIQRIDPD